MTVSKGYFTTSFKNNFKTEIISHLGKAREQPTLVVEGVLMAGQPLELVGHLGARALLLLLDRGVQAGGGGEACKGRKRFS